MVHLVFSSSPDPGAVSQSILRMSDFRFQADIFWTRSILDASSGYGPLRRARDIEVAINVGHQADQKYWQWSAGSTFSSRNRPGSTMPFAAGNKSRLATSNVAAAYRHA